MPTTLPGVFDGRRQPTGPPPGGTGGSPAAARRKGRDPLLGGPPRRPLGRGPEGARPPLGDASPPQARLRGCDQAGHLPWAAGTAEVDLPGPVAGRRGRASPRPPGEARTAPQTPGGGLSLSRPHRCAIERRRHTPTSPALRQGGGPAKRGMTPCNRLGISNLIGRAARTPVRAHIPAAAAIGLSSAHVSSDTAIPDIRRRLKLRVVGSITDEPSSRDCLGKRTR